MNAYLKDLDTITNWKPFTFDGTNSPSTGVLCKWADGTIDFYDPRVHRGHLSSITFIENDDPDQQETDKKYVPWMEGGTKKEETIEGIGCLVFVGLIIGLLIILRCLGL